MQFARINDVAIHYRVIGARAEKPVIVLINSLGTDFRIWDDVVAQLADDFAVVLYDKRGHGLSDIGRIPYSIEDHASDLAALLDFLSIKCAIVCGLSVGGLIALALCQRRPELVSALILCDTAHRIGTAESWNARIAAVRKDGLESIVHAVMERWFTPAFRRADNAAYAGCRHMLTRQPVDGYVATCAAIRDADYTAAARAVTVPTLCIVGDQDGSTPPDLVLGMAQLIPDMRYEVIRDCAHIPCVEQPEALTALISAFLSPLLPENGAMTESASASDRFREGMVTRRSVLGDAHVDRAGAATTDFDRPFQELITEAAWGHVWSRPALSKRERSMITIALLAALGQDDEVAMHVRATANTGATREDIREALLHVAIYAGVPAANHAIKIAKKVFAEMDAGRTG